MSTAAWIGVIALLALVAIGAGLVLFTRHIARRVEAAVPAHGRFAEIGGHRLHYVDTADDADDDGTARAKPTLVLVHGLGAQLQHMTHSLLARLAPDFRIVAVDRPGTGWSVRERGSSHGLRAQGDVVAGLIGHLGLDRPVVVGHSLGGAVALALGLDHPDKTRGLVLVAPLTQPTDDVPEIFQGLVIRNAVRRRLTAWTLATPLGIRHGEAVRDTAFGPEAAPADFDVAGGALLGLRPGSFETASADLVAIPEELPGMKARYGDLAVPVAVIHGDRDALIPVDTARTFAAETGASLAVLDDAGHMIPITRADEVAAFVAEHAREWFAGAAARAADEAGPATGTEPVTGRQPADGQPEPAPLRGAAS